MQAPPRARHLPCGHLLPAVVTQVVGNSLRYHYDEARQKGSGDELALSASMLAVTQNIIGTAIEVGDLKKKDPRVRTGWHTVDAAQLCAAALAHAPHLFTSTAPENRAMPPRPAGLPGPGRRRHVLRHSGHGFGQRQHRQLQVLMAGGTSTDQRTWRPSRPAERLHTTPTEPGCTTP